MFARWSKKLGNWRFITANLSFFSEEGTWWWRWHSAIWILNSWSGFMLWMKVLNSKLPRLRVKRRGSSQKTRHGLESTINITVRFLFTCFVPLCWASNGFHASVHGWKDIPPPLFFSLMGKTVRFNTRGAAITWWPRRECSLANANPPRHLIIITLRSEVVQGDQRSFCLVTLAPTAWTLPLYQLYEFVSLAPLGRIHNHEYEKLTFQKLILWMILLPS